MALYASETATIPEFIDASPSNSGVISTVSVSNNPALIFGADASRKGFTIFNNSLQPIFIGIDGNVTINDNFFAIVPPKSLYEWSGANPFTGEIYGVAETYLDGASVQAFTFS